MLSRKQRLYILYFYVECNMGLFLSKLDDEVPGCITQGMCLAPVVDVLIVKIFEV